MEEVHQIRSQHPVETDQLSEIADKFDKTLTLEESSSSSSSTSTLQNESDENLISSTHEIEDEDEDEDEDDEDENDDEKEEEFEFSFFGDALKSPVSAEEVFEDGQIRIIAPFSGETEPSTTSYRPPVKNYFVVSDSPENDDVAEGAYCVWKSPSPEMSKKSNSTGFSKLRKMRDLLARSNSDGKDAFVFLNGKNDETTSSSKKDRKSKLKLEKKKSKEGETTAFGGERKETSSTTTAKKTKKSAYEVLYGGGDKKKGGGKSYLPYRQDLVGFFTNGSGMSRNVHPY